jgi:hypothetical protein
MFGTRIPPSSLHTEPEAYPFSIIYRTVIANHYDLPSMPNGTTFFIVAFFTYGGILSFIGVSNIPGAIVITLIFLEPKSLAIGNVIALIAPFVAEYITWLVLPSSAKTLDTFIITPLYPFTYAWLAICFAACLLRLKVPMTLIFKILSKFSDEPTFLSGEIVMAGINTPAQFTTASILPYFLTVN